MTCPRAANAWERALPGVNGRLEDQPLRGVMEAAGDLFKLIVCVGAVAAFIGIVVTVV